MIDLKEKKQELLTLFSNESSFLSKKKLKEVQTNIVEKQLPNNKTEEWKNTNLNGILKHKFVLGETVLCKEF